MIIRYQYTFTTHFFDNWKNPHVFQVIASNDSIAMKCYCMNEGVQDLNMKEIDRLIITHVLIE